jgi:hypothetical protein
VRKAISILLIITVVLLGAIYGHFSFLRHKGIVKSISEYITYLIEATETVPRPHPVDVEGKPITGAEKKPISPADAAARPEIRPTEVPTAQKIEKPKPAIDKDLVAALLRESAELYRKMNYKESAKKSREVISMLEKAGMEGTQLHTDAVQIETRSRVFDALVSKIPPNTLSDGKDLVEIELDSGRTITVRVLKEDPKTGALTIQQNDGIQAMLSEDQIRKRTPISAQDYTRKLTEELDRRIAKAKKDLYFDMFSVAIYAIQNRLTHRVTELLEKTFAMEGSELAFETFYTGKDQTEMVTMLLDSFGRGEKAQSVKVAQLPEKSTPGSGAEPLPETVDAPPLPDPVLERNPGAPGQAGADLDFALRCFGAGQRYAKQATLNAAKRFQYGQDAQKYLEKAADVLEKLREQNPDDPELEQILIQVYDLLQYVVHNLIGAKK